jgi:transcriptional regulator with XRE-family HTH domain
MEPFDTTVKATCTPNDTIEEAFPDTGIHGSPLGSRIREERQRLGVSQAILAQRLGVHRKTQVNYELGQRKPDTDYLEALAREGVDVGYVLTGESRREVEQVYSNILDSLMVALDLYKGFEQEWQTVYEIVRQNWRASGNGDSLPIAGDAAVRALLAKSPRVLGGPEELCELLERIEFVAEAAGLVLSPRQKASAVFSLFQEKRRSGATSVDFATVKQALDRRV